MNAIEITNLCKSYGDFTLDHLNLTLQKIGQQWKVTAAAVERVQLQGTEKGKDAENK